jgi:hypothetical protein
MGSSLRQFGLIAAYRHRFLVARQMTIFTGPNIISGYRKIISSRINKKITNSIDLIHHHHHHHHYHHHHHHSSNGFFALARADASLRLIAFPISSTANVSRWSQHLKRLKMMISNLEVIIPSHHVT